MDFNNYCKLIDNISGVSKAARADNVIEKMKIKERQNREHFIKNGMLSVDYDGKKWLSVWVTLKDKKELAGCFNKAEITRQLNTCCAVLKLYEK